MLFDGNALAHRVYHALPRLTTPKGELVNAVYGFLASLLSAIKEHEPRYLVVVFDSPGKTFRHKLYKDYKSTRVKPPQEFYDQLPLLKRVLKTMNIPVIAIEGYEGEDLIAAIGKKLPSVDTIIVTGDNDVLSLVTPRTAVLTMRRGIKDTVFYNPKTVRQKLGFDPAYLVDYKALLGDVSDNIPGVPGVGEKTAQALIVRYKTVENLYRSLRTLDPKLGQKLETYRDQVMIAKQLAKINDEAPVTLTLKEAQVHDFNERAVVKLFNELGFKSLINRLPHLKQSNLFDDG